ncbi:MAG: DUF2283 domain-containing protein [Candidatus Bipolaricaulota bacterium]
MKITYDPQRNAADIRLSEKRGEVETVRTSDELNIDLAPDGTACGGDLAAVLLRLPTARAVHEKTMLQRQITATDHQINQLVYGLYGLTADEIKIVEEAVGTTQ